MTQMSLSMKQKQTHGHREQTWLPRGRRRGEGGGGSLGWEVGVSRCKRIYIEWITTSYCIAQGTIFDIP